MSLQGWVSLVMHSVPSVVILIASCVAAKKAQNRMVWWLQGFSARLAPVGSMKAVFGVSAAADVVSVACDAV